MPFFNSSFDENWYGNPKVIQYFMYGLLVSYNKYKEKFGELKSNDDIHGIFRGRDGEFLIIGKVLENCFIKRINFKDSCISLVSN